MGKAPDALLRLVETRDMTEIAGTVPWARVAWDCPFPAISARVPSRSWYSMATTPDAPLRLVDRFDSNRKACPERAASDAVRSRRVFQSPDYKEEQLRLEFLGPA
jgi:hypothetical protein